ncbi:MAG: hypothetical protein OXE50_15910 [Chloroflexi bacterium]|nr:hypothetical protein [Chloroflexota bacterium]
MDYIKNEIGDDLAHGSCVIRKSRSGSRIEEADIYIKAPGITETVRMAITGHAGYVDSEHAVYSVVDDLYSTILHETGHAVGLKHIRSPENLTSLLPYTSGAWDSVSLRLYAMSHLRYSQCATGDPLTIPFVFRIDSMRQSRVRIDTEELREAWAMFSLALEPGPQDRTALMCICEIEQAHEKTLVRGQSP